MFFWKSIQLIFTAGFLTFGLMLVLFAIGSFLPTLVWLVALYPGIVLSQSLFFVLPVAAIDWLVGDTDNAPTAFASASVIFSFLFWWLCSFLLLQIRTFFMTKRALA